MAVFIVAAPEVLFIKAFKHSAGLIYNQTAVFRSSFHLNAAIAEGNIGVFVKLLCFAEVLVCFEIDFVIVEQAADVAHHNVIVYAAGKRHNLPIAQLFKEKGFCLFKGKVFV